MLTDSNNVDLQIPRAFITHKTPKVWRFLTNASPRKHSAVSCHKGQKKNDNQLSNCLIDKVTLWTQMRTLNTHCCDVARPLLCCVLMNKQRAGGGRSVWWRCWSSCPRRALAVSLGGNQHAFPPPHFSWMSMVPELKLMCELWGSRLRPAINTADPSEHRRLFTFQAHKTETQAPK